jgi:ABC-2 type transport system ATP-binding protein
VTPTPTLTVRDLVVTRGGRRVVDGLDLEVAAGAVVSLLGPNGAGKSTTVAAIAGLLDPDRGTILLEGEPLDGRRHEIGIATQETGAYPQLTVAENLSFCARLARVPRPTLNGRVREAAERLDLSALLDRPAGELSGGERRRLHVASALVATPRLVILDEPTAGLDVDRRSQLLDVVRALAAAGTAVLYTTHYLPEVEALGAHVVVIEGGVAVAAGSVGALVDAHARGYAEITLDGDGPPPLPADPTDDPHVYRVPLPNPEQGLADLIASLGTEAGRVRSISVMSPGLEAALLALTGRTYRGEADDARA